jgi:hypothetical protein
MDEHTIGLNMGHNLKMSGFLTAFAQPRKVLRELLLVSAGAHERGSFKQPRSGYRKNMVRSLY